MNKVASRYNGFDPFSTLLPMLSLKKHASAKLEFDSLSNVAEVFLSNTNFDDLVQSVVDRVLLELEKLGKDFHVAVLALKSGESLKRVTMSQTEAASNIRGASRTAFEEIETPLTAEENLCIKSMNDKQNYLTYSFVDILHPPFSIEKCERLQAAGGIATSIVFPVVVQNESIGIIIFSTKRHIEKLQEREIAFTCGLVSIIGIAVTNSRLFSQVQKERNQLEVANEKLLQLDKLKDEFVSLASHELRTPMVSIRNYIWMVLNGKGGKVNPKQREYLRRAYDSTSRLSRLVNSMLNLSRIESGRVILSVEQADIRKVIKDVLIEIGVRAEKAGIKLALSQKVSSVKTGDPVQLPTVLIDIDKIREVLINLIGNSLKFTPSGGSIILSLAVDKDHVLVRIADTGIGLEDDQIPKLFKKFSMLRESYSSNATMAQGTGLGLYISKSIIKLHRGKIWVESEGRGKGATFSFTVLRYSEEHLQLLHRNQHNGADAGIIHSAVADY